MIHFKVKNLNTYYSWDTSEELKALKTILTSKVKTCRFDIWVRKPVFEDVYFNFYNNRTCTFYSGLLGDTCRTLKQLGYQYKWEDLREKPQPTLLDLKATYENENWIHQEDAAAAFLSKGRGVIHVGTGGGKTQLQELIIEKLKIKVAIIVPTIDLVHQTAIEFKKTFSGINILEFQSKVKQVDWSKIDVMIVTSKLLSSRYQRDLALKTWIMECPFLVLDESHHVNKVLNKKTVRDNQLLKIRTFFIGSYYILGLSGSLKINPFSERVLQASCGKILYERNVSELTEDGVLSPARVIACKYDHPEKNITTEQLQEHNSKLTLKNEEGGKRVFNKDMIISKWQWIKPDFLGSELLARYIALLAKEAADAGLTTIWYSRSVSVQIPLISKSMNEVELEHVVLTGKERSYIIRNEIKQRLKDKKLKTLVTSVFGEGIDVPVLDGVGICDGGKPSVTLVQKIGRALRRAEGKTYGYIWDFYHLWNTSIKSHSLKRFKYYRQAGHEIAFYELERIIKDLRAEKIT